MRKTRYPGFVPGSCIRATLPVGTIMIEDLLQPRHLLVILAIAILFFGPQKLPELGKGLAQGIRSFKDSLKEVNSDTPSKPKD